MTDLRKQLEALVEREAEKYGLEVAQRFSSVPDDRVNRHDVSKAGKLGAEFGANLLLDAVVEMHEGREEIAQLQNIFYNLVHACPGHAEVRIDRDLLNKLEHQCKRAARKYDQALSSLEKRFGGES